MKKRNNVVRWGIFVLLIGWAIYALVPTYKVYFSEEKDQIESIKLKNKLKDIRSKEQLGKDLTRYEKELIRAYKNDSSLYEVSESDINRLNTYFTQKDKSLNLGLDLQGGMHLVLEVDYAKMLRNMAKIKDPKLDELISIVQKQTVKDKSNYFNILSSVFDKNSLPLNKYYGKKGQSNSSIVQFLDSVSTRSVETSLEVLRNRINQYGISEPSIQKQGKKRIVVELPGVSDEERATQMVNRAAFLEFKLVAKPEIVKKKLDQIDNILKKTHGLNTEVSNDTTLASKPKINPETDSESASELFDEQKDVATADSSDNDKKAINEAYEKDHPFTSLLIGGRMGEMMVKKENILRVEKLLSDNKVRSALGKYELVWKNIPLTVQGEIYYEFLIVNSKTEMDGTRIIDANAAMASGNTATGGWEVNFNFSRTGAKEFTSITGNNVGSRLAIILDGKYYSAPNIKDRIAGGRAKIDGNFNAESARDLAIVLKAGALEAPLEVIHKRVIGPTLGKDSIKSGLMASLIGLGLVMTFMLIWYKLFGLFSIIALTLNLFFIMATLAYFRGTLTLPGIAGIILTIGMAVDANVLIFERIKEELRGKRTANTAVNAGYEKAFSTIFDANITTLIAGIVLYQFGTGPVKGFALTMMIGIMWSMFTAIVVSRLFVDLSINKDTKKLSI